jgi:hypothetical protein
MSLIGDQHSRGKALDSTTGCGINHPRVESPAVIMLKKDIFRILVNNSHLNIEDFRFVISEDLQGN